MGTVALVSDVHGLCKPLISFLHPRLVVSVVLLHLALAWPGLAWLGRYSGVVDDYDSTTGMHHISYDDGDKRWYDMTKKVYRVNDAAEDAAPARSPSADARVKLPAPITQVSVATLTAAPRTM